MKVRDIPRVPHATLQQPLNIEMMHSFVLQFLSFTITAVLTFTCYFTKVVLKFTLYCNKNTNSNNERQEDISCLLGVTMVNHSNEADVFLQQRCTGSTQSVYSVYMCNLQSLPSTPEFLISGFAYFELVIFIFFLSQR